MPKFEPGDNVHANVRALRKALGSAVRELSRADLARLVSERHPGKRRLGATTIERWEADVEPDYASSRVMAELAGTDFDAFTREVSRKRGGKGHVLPAREPDELALPKGKAAKGGREA